MDVIHSRANCLKNKDYEGRQFDSIKKGIAWSLGSRSY